MDSYTPGAPAASLKVAVGQHTDPGVKSVNQDFHGLCVPDDVAVAGFADIPTLRDVVPGLTTVHIPLVEMGVAATRLALSEPSDEPRLLRVPADVVLRDSTPARR